MMFLPTLFYLASRVVTDAFLITVFLRFGFVVKVARVHGNGGCFSDIVLFAEKHRETQLEKGYFRPDKIRQMTADYIPELKESECRFELVNEGFYFKDCYVASSAREEGTNYESYDLIILFEKNERDERIILAQNAVRPRWQVTPIQR